MTPLFALEPFTPPRDTNAARARAGHSGAPSPAAAPPFLVPYRINGVFRFGSGNEHDRTVQGHGIRTRLHADIDMFVAYLGDSGWLFEDGRAVLVKLLSVDVESDEGNIAQIVPQYTPQTSTP